MVTKILVSLEMEKIENEVNSLLKNLNLTPNHPDVLVLDTQKLNLEQAKQIKDFFQFKPYQAKGKVAVVKNVKEATTQAQNALLKTIEELPEHGIVLLGTHSEDVFLPTILSRCEIIKFDHVEIPNNPEGDKELPNFLNYPIQEKFYYIEKIKDKEQFLVQLIKYFQNQLYYVKTFNEIASTVQFLKLGLEAQKWARSNVNIRGILEYLAINIPKI